jgi:hypothetical protein
MGLLRRHAGKSKKVFFFGGNRSRLESGGLAWWMRSLSGNALYLARARAVMARGRAPKWKFLSGDNTALAIPGLAWQTREPPPVNTFYCCLHSNGLEKNFFFRLLLASLYYVLWLLACYVF